MRARVCARACVCACVCACVLKRESARVNMYNVWLVVCCLHFPAIFLPQTAQSLRGGKREGGAAHVSMDLWWVGGGGGVRMELCLLVGGGGGGWVKGKECGGGGGGGHWYDWDGGAGDLLGFRV